MTKYDHIGANITPIKLYIRMGYISPCVLNHFRIYTQYINYLAMGVSVAKAIFLLAEENKVSEQTIYRIKWEMEEEL